MGRSTRFQELFDSHISHYCMDYIRGNYDEIITDPAFLNMTFLLKDETGSGLSSILQKYVDTMRMPSDISILVEVGYYDSTLSGMDDVFRSQSNECHIIQMCYFFKDQPISPSIRMRQEMIFHDDNPDDRPEIFMLDILKACIEQDTASPTIYIEDYA